MTRNRAHQRQIARIIPRENRLINNAAVLSTVPAVSEFAQELGAAMESHSANVRRLVDEFRGRSGDSRVDTGGMRRVWESLLRQVEADAASQLDLAAVLQQQLSRPTLEASFHRKLQSRKVSLFLSLFFFLSSYSRESDPKSRNFNFATLTLLRIICAYLDAP